MGKEVKLKERNLWEAKKWGSLKGIICEHPNITDKQRRTDRSKDKRTDTITQS